MIAPKTPDAVREASGPETLARLWADHHFGIAWEHLDPRSRQELTAACQAAYDWLNRPLAARTAALDRRAGDAGGTKVTQAMVDAALDAEWTTDAGGDVPAVGYSYSIREAMEEFGASLSTLEIENAMSTALAAALNPQTGNEWAIAYDREGPR